MKYVVIHKLTSKLENEIESFLDHNTSTFNPLFSSPLWAKRLEQNSFFKYNYLLAYDKDENIVALHLFFKAFKGERFIHKLFPPFNFVLREFLKFFTSYITWFSPPIVQDKLSEENYLEIKKMFYEKFDQKSIYNAPIFDQDKSFLKMCYVRQWATAILDFENKSYDEIYLKFKRQARKSIDKTLDMGIVVKKLTYENIPQYVKWLKEVQNETGKNYYLNESLFYREYDLFSQKKYFFEIFIAFQGNRMLGSLGIWGFDDYVSEWGAYTSAYAKEKKIYIQDLIKDEIVKFCLVNKIKKFDLSGYNPQSDASQKEKAIRQFKEKWGGDEVLYCLIKGK